MSVGDKELFVRKSVHQCVYCFFALDLTQGVRHALAVGKFFQNGQALRIADDPAHRAFRVAVKRVNGREIASRCAHQTETVVFGFGKCFLVRKHHALRKRNESDQAYQAVKGVGFACDLKALAVEIDTCFFVFCENAVCEPFGEKRACICVAVFAAARELQTDQVMLVGVAQRRVFRIADDIVRRTDAGRKCARLLRVPQRADRFDGSHFCFLLL